MENSRTQRGRQHTDITHVRPVLSAGSILALPRRDAGGRWAQLAARVAPVGYVLPALALYAVFVLWPLAWLIGLSLREGDGSSAPRR